MVCPIKKIVFTELEHPFFVAIHRQLITTAFWQCLSMSLLTDEKEKQTDSYNSKTSKCTRQKLLVLVVVIDLLLVLLLGSSFWLWLAITHKVDDRQKKQKRKWGWCMDDLLLKSWENHFKYLLLNNHHPKVYAAQNKLLKSFH